MEILRIIGKQFKGKPEFDYTLGHVTTFKGQNGSGKTTVGATAPLWVLTGYGADLKSNPKVDNINSVESEPSVTVVCEHNGKQFSITKTQHIKTVQDGDIVKKSTNNTFMFNDVPITERDLKKKMLEMGIDPDKLLELMHPMVVMGEKAQDIKKMLFEMSTEKSPLEVSKLDVDTLELSKELEEGYDLEEITAKYKASKKKSDEAIKAIPEQIIGLEKAKSSADPQPLLERKEEIEKIISDLKAEAESKDNSKEISEIRTQLFEVKREISEHERKEADRAAHFKRQQAERSLEIKRKINDIKCNLMTHRQKQDDAEFQIKRWQRAKAEAAQKYRDAKKEKAPVFTAPPKLTENDMVCPCCGQKLPEDLRKKKILEWDEANTKAARAFDKELAKWQKDHDERIKKITEEGQTACDKIRECEATIEKVGQAMGRANEDLKHQEDLLEQAQHEEAVKPYVPDMASTQQLDKLRERESYLTQLLQTSSQIKFDKSAYDEAIARMRVELAGIQQKLAVIENNDSITAKISVLQEERMEFEQAKATAEKMLYQIDILSRRMNDLFVEEINSHFSLVKWQLFEYQKNGTYKEICVPTIDGYRFGESTNTGREIRGKLDICQSLQKFYGMRVPIILDNAESINDFNLPELDSQLILLSVTDDKELVVEHD